MGCAGPATWSLLVSVAAVVEGYRSQGGFGFTKHRGIGLALQKLASRLGVPVVAGSQFNRAAADREPKLADLRESGSIEQDADLVLMISRPDQLDPDTTRVGEADVIIGKNRHGRADAVVTVSQQLHYSRFANAASEQVPPDPPKPNLHAV